MAEDDDDDSFGDFTFASFPSNPPTMNQYSNQINGSKFAHKTDDDDGWGDFLDYRPAGSKPASNTSDPFAFSSEASQAQSGSAIRPVVWDVSLTDPAKKAQWVKPQGALPLSIFGDIEEVEEKSDEIDAKDVFSKGMFGVKGEKENGFKLHSGVGFNDVIASFYNQNQQIKAEDVSTSISSGVDMNEKDSIFERSELTSSAGSLSMKDYDIAVTSTNQNPQMKIEDGLDTNSKRSGSNTWSPTFDGLNSISGVDVVTILGESSQPIKTQTAGSSSGSNINGSASKDFKGWGFGFDGFDPNSRMDSLNVSGLNSALDAKSERKEANDGGSGDGDNDDDVDDYGWEFKDAYSGSKVGDENDKGNTKAHEFPAFDSFFTGFDNHSDGPIDFFVTSNESLDLFPSLNGSIDLFAMPNRSPTTSVVIDGGFDSNSSIAAQNGFFSDSYLKSNQRKCEGGPDSDDIVTGAESDEDFGDFSSAFVEVQAKQEGEETILNLRGALPLSIFGDEEPETDGSSTLEYDFSHQPVNTSSDHHSNSAISINDLISNLYEKAQKVSSPVSAEQKATAGFSPDSILNPDFVNGVDELDDGSWEFRNASSEERAEDDGISNLYNKDEQIASYEVAEKSTEISFNRDSLLNMDLTNDADDHDDGFWEYRDAFPEIRSENEASSFGLEDANQSSSTALKLNNFLDFYSSLKDELYFILRHHLESLKKVRGIAALSGQDIEVAALDKQIQDAYKELDRVTATSSSNRSEYHLLRDNCINGFVEVLQDPRFQVLESEYHLSQQLISVETDLTSAIELIRHATRMLKILKLGSSKDQSIYFATWSRIIKVCLQELQHGALIWKQILEKGVQSQIISASKGKKFILSLGEIYRVIVLLGASSRLYRPWSLGCPESGSIFSLLDECHTLWSSSGLQHALPHVSCPASLEDNNVSELLSDFIKCIDDLDETALQNHVIDQCDVTCRLSLLSSQVVTGMKMVHWNGEPYFVTLANLWANLISGEPPKLPSLVSVDEKAS